MVKAKFLLHLEPFQAYPGWAWSMLRPVKAHLDIWGWAVATWLLGVRATLKVSFRFIFFCTDRNKYFGKKISATSLIKSSNMIIFYYEFFASQKWRSRMALQYT
jgi:hypothetical protein